LLENIQRLRAAAKLPVFVYGESNLRYYTGLAALSGGLLIDKEETLITRDMELARNAPIANIVQAKERTVTELFNILKQKKIRKIGLDFESLTYELSKKFQAKKIKLVDVSEKLSGIRAIKSREEMGKIARASELADKAMTEVANNLSAGMSERHVRNYALSILPQAEDVAFSFIIASGPNSEYTHAYPSERRIALGDLVIVDIGFKVDGYCSDLTRTFCLSPTSQQKGLYNKVLEAQRLAIAAIAPGTPCKKIWSKVESFFKKDDLDRFWKYSLGHGVGLDIHEAPSLSKESGETLKNGMTFTIEPGIHIPDFGGVRIEDTFLLDKRLRPLTNSDYTLDV
jgi:Xaa-Pro aminopeptidase